MRKPSGWFLLFLVVLLMEPVLPRRGGISAGRSMSRSRGSSGARASSGRTHSGGGYRPSGRTNNNNGGYQRGTNYGAGGGSHNSRIGQKTGGGWSGSNWNKNRGSGRGGWSGPSHRSTYSKGSGVGSLLRSRSFKGAVLGAAAGYLTYQAGKAIIRSAMGPMMWNNRPYYWGQSYYRPRHGQTQMCRMPVDNNDQQFGNVYFQDQTRPREIVWGCGAYEYCCGYECCRGGGASRYGGYGISFGTLALAFLVFCCCLPLLCLYCRRSGIGLFAR